MTRRTTTLALAVAAAIAACSVPASAQLVATVQLEGGADVMLPDGIERGSEWGGHAAARVGLELLRPLAVQLGYASAWLPFDGIEHAHVDAFQLGLRASILMGDGVVAGPFLDVNVGVGVVGGAARLVWDVAAGFEIAPIADVAIGSSVRYYHVLEPTGDPDASSARALAFNLNVTWRIGLGGSTPAPEPAPEPTVVPDVDEDGIADSRDLCPDEAEDLDDYRDEDGCPDPENDRGGLAGEIDPCSGGYQTADGGDDCPEERAVPPPALEEVVRRPPALEEERAVPPPTLDEVRRPMPVMLPNSIRFRAGSARVSPRFARSIRRTCRRLAARPSFRVRVVGYTDQQGALDANLRLSTARAAAVAELLVRCGVASERIEVASHGQARPICSTASPRCWARNRRVELELVRQ